ncbi:MAG: FGGY family carbohydrate kinase, partial [Candidatus Uhrbacteria bacterium]
MSASSKKKYILALDLGTTSVRAMVFDKQMNVVAISQKPYKVFFTCQGCIEQDAEEIWAKTRQVMRGALIKGKVKAAQIEALGITNQRETTVVWSTITGKPIYPAIVWQDRRTHDICERIKQAGHEEMIKKKTGLVVDPYFSATKIQWILKHADHRIKKDHLKFGTIDSWIIWKLTNGKVHATDVSNASRTMLFDIRKLEWDQQLLRLFHVPESMLPMVVNSSGKIGEVHDSIIGCRIPITGVCGDQQAALFGQGCYKKGDMKNTYGTGAFLLMNTGSRPRFTKQPLLTTVAWQIDNKVTYALEGSVFSCGTVIKWLEEEMQAIREPAEA